MNSDAGKSAAIRLSTQLLYFMDYKIHEYSPEELYENKARLFEQLMMEWNNMSANEQEKYHKKVLFTQGGEKAKYRKNESALETLYETAVEKHEQNQNQIIEEKQTSLEEIKAPEIIKEQQNSSYFEKLKQENLNSNQDFSEKETNSQQHYIKSKKSQIIQKIEEPDVDINKNQTSEDDENLKQENEQIIQHRLKRGDQSKKHFQKGKIENFKSKRSSIQKKALSPSKQKQLDKQKNQKYFSVDETLTLKQLKEQIKNVLKLNE